MFTTRPGRTIREAMDDENQPSGCVFRSFASTCSCRVVFRLDTHIVDIFGPRRLR